MTFFAFGINHQTAPLGIREAFALSEEKQRALYRSLTLSEGGEVILLSTCNRTEVYLYGTEADVQAVQREVTAQTGHVWPEAGSFLVRDEEAVCHLLQLTSGLRSMVVGDAQIVAQVKDAYRIAVEEDTVNTILHRLIHSAFRAAKRVASETGISSGAASVSSAAVAMARAHVEQAGWGGLDGCRVLLIGAGQMGRLALQALSRYDLASLAVTNRSQERAQMVAEVIGAEVVDWADRHEAAAGADLVIVATAAQEPVLRTDDLPEQAAAHTETLIIDIAVPRNVDPALDARAGYKVLELDALQAWTRGVERLRRSETPAAEQICDEVLAEFVAWMFHQQALQPVIQAIRDTFDGIRAQEIERHHHRFAGTDREQLDLLTRSIMQKLLAIPIVRLKSIDPDSIDFVRGIKMLQMLFSRPDCDDAAAPTDKLADMLSRKEPAPDNAVENKACPFEGAEEKGSADQLLPLLQALQDARNEQGLA